MTDRKNDDRNKRSDAADTEASLQDELSREAAEGTDSIGDIESNRTVTGSSSWATLPEEGRASKPGKESGQSQTPSGDKKER